MNVVNSAFTTIRAATALGPKSVPVDFGDGVQGRVYSIPAIVTPYPNPLRHPIYWWKMRHLRADIKELEAAIHPTIRAKLDAIENEAFIHGRGR